MTSFIEYQGKTILKIDLTNVLSLDGAKAIAEKAYKLVRLNRSGDLLVLYHFDNFKFLKSILETALPYLNEVKDKVIRRAFLTNDSEQARTLVLLAKGLNIDDKTEVFRNETTAMNYLVGDDYFDKYGDFNK